MPSGIMMHPGWRWLKGAPLGLALFSISALAEHVVEVRIEVVNLLNHVNLGNPDSEVGVPGNLNSNAGRINSTAYFNADPQRQVQFGIKYKF